MKFTAFFVVYECVYPWLLASSSYEAVETKQTEIETETEIQNAAFKAHKMAIAMLIH